MEGSPWICPRCGTPTNVDACPQCFHERPFAASATNEPGSYFRITQGPMGYAGMPRGMGIGCLLLMIFTVAAAFFQSRYGR